MKVEMAIRKTCKISEMHPRICGLVIGRTERSDYGEVEHAHPESNSSKMKFY